ncbi:hypothetical protein AMTR_s00100p00114300, partial [Amborella trichopoda]
FISGYCLYKNPLLQTPHLLKQQPPLRNPKNPHHFQPPLQNRNPHHLQPPLAPRKNYPPVRYLIFKTQSPPRKPFRSNPRNLAPLPNPTPYNVPLNPYFRPQKTFLPPSASP